MIETKEDLNTGVTDVDAVTQELPKVDEQLLIMLQRLTVDNKDYNKSNRDGKIEILTKLSQDLFTFMSASFKDAVTSESDAYKMGYGDGIESGVSTTFGAMRKAKINNNKINLTRVKLEGIYGHAVPQTWTTRTYKSAQAKQPTSIPIIVNGKRMNVNKNRLSYEEIVKLAAVEDDGLLVGTPSMLWYSKDPKNDGIVHPGGHLQLFAKETVISVCHTGNA